MKPMRIAFLIPDLRGGGAQHMTINMANEFTRRGHDVTLLVIQDQGPFKDKIAADVKTIYFNTARSVTAIPKLARYLRKEKPDILYSAMTYVNMIAVLAKFLSGHFKLITVISERNFFSLNANQNGDGPTWLQRLSLGLLYPLADKIVGISAGVADDIKRYLWRGQEKVAWIHNPVVTPEMLSSYPAANLNQSVNQPIIITSGRLVPQKDHSTLLRAFAKLRSQRPAQLMILGEGPLKHELEQLARSLNIADDVTFVGFVGNSAEYMSQAHLFVLSSAWEGFCNVLVQALLHGLPVVSTDCPSGPREILADGTYGHLVPVGDVDALASAMARALIEPVNPDQQRTRALDFSAEKICGQYEDLFTNLYQQVA